MSEDDTSSILEERTVNGHTIVAIDSGYPTGDVSVEINGEREFRESKVGHGNAKQSAQKFLRGVVRGLELES